jgi:hypothetical protein
VSFSAPADNGSPISSYTVTAHDNSDPSHASDGKTVSGDASPVVVDGLRNGDRYTFTVTATNAVGTGAPSDPSDEVTPADVPGAPSAVSAAPGAAKATVSFSAPSGNGSPISSYTVTAHDKSDPSHASDGKTVSGDASPVVVDGLRNGDRYTFTVTATNAVGTGPASDPSDEVTPADVPGAPRQVSALASDGQAVVSFIAPESDGGSPITGYEVVTHDKQGGAVTQTSRAALSLPAGGTKSPITLTGLTNGHSYTFTVIASNAAGAGPSSDPSAAVIPAAVPGAPTAVSATASDGEAVVSFSAPGSDNGSPITGYEVTAHDKSNPLDASDGKAVSGPSSPVTVSGLVNGHTYNFTATATNAVGTGPASEPSAPVTPTARRTPSSPGESPVKAPDARTEAAKDVKASSATLAGTVGPQGLEASFRFEYGTSSSYGSTTSNGVAGAGMSTMPVSAALQRLSPNTVYHYRLVAINSAGTSYGADMTFRTSKRLPKTGERKSGRLETGHRSTLADHRGTRVVLRCVGDSGAVCSGSLWLVPTPLRSRLQASGVHRGVAFKLVSGQKKRLYVPLPDSTWPQLGERRKAVVRAIARLDGRGMVNRLLTVYPR